ncbi:hypothetical protein QA447_05535 [Pseudomonas sp. abacavir_1]
MAEDPRVTALDEHYFKGLLTFDQFVLGGSLAACAYLAQTAGYGRVGWNAKTLGLFPLLAMAVATWLGFKRVEITIHLLKSNARYLELCTQNPGRDFTDQYKVLKRIADRTGSIYDWRNRALLLGLASYVLIRIACQYPIF